ncbi:hypothetical protein OIU84_029708 [Salix udensis]|uniref:COP9 signalosome complex subunit 3 N-terminal helical repeats domain-containing protein n=1 Tax=Salix udensis TaxID=889485 RepID=A0AAD6KA77_9ROSI|nr:hypothetical protein OIU84_029708 [Salix udensis]
MATTESLGAQIQGLSSNVVDLSLLSTRFKKADEKLHNESTRLLAFLERLFTHSVIFTFSVSKKFKDQVLMLEVPTRGVGPLLEAVKKLRSSSEHLTALHPDFLQLCLLAKCYKTGLSILEDVLFEKALELLHNAVTTPMPSINTIAVEAFKKYIFWFLSFKIGWFYCLTNFLLPFEQSPICNWQPTLCNLTVLKRQRCTCFTRPEEMALKRLSGEGDLKMFIESADKVVLLLEFCGWTEKLIAREKNNGSKTGYGVQGFDGESNVISTPRGKENQKVDGDRKWRDEMWNGKWAWRNSLAWGVCLSK